LEDFNNTDLTSDSTASPGSSISPNGATSYPLPTADEWTAWDKFDQQPEADFLKTEPFEESTLTSVPAQNVSLSPAINPMDLANSGVEDVTLGQEGINDQQPLFQTLSQNVSLSPAINPMDLANSGVEDVTLGQEGINDQQPLFQTLSQTVQVALPTSSPTIDVKTSSSLSPEPLAQVAAPEDGKRYPSRNLKRKSSCDSDDDDDSQRSSASPPPALRRSSTKDSGKSETGPKKTAHNMIEKRYRTNLNDKIAALRDSVPALRVMVHKLEHQGSDDEADDVFPGFGHTRAEDLGGLEPAHKLNKATILSKATEYIAHLERKNRNLAKENSSLRNKVDGFEMLMMGRNAQATPIWT
jgi:hypothetical protein